MIIGIVAIAKNYAIGKNGKLPWHYPADLKFFKETTTGNAIVMGSNTWRSIGKPLPDRLNIVLSRSQNIETPPGVIVLCSKVELLALANYLKCDLFMIGGEKVFTEFADVIEKWIVTEIPLAVEDADTFMPKDFLAKFKLSEVQQLDDALTAKTYVLL
jgi:dihydrofolate reductase